MKRPLPPLTDFVGDLPEEHDDIGGGPGFGRLLVAAAFCVALLAFCSFDAWPWSPT